MLTYLPLIITFALGVSGVWLRTKREGDKLVNRPTVGGWIVLALLLAALSAGIGVERGKQRAARTAHETDSLRQLVAEQNYKYTIGLLQSQLRETQALSTGSDSSFRAQFLLASHQLAFLRRLFLLQHELSGVEVSWKPDPRQVQAFVDSLRGYRSRVQQRADEGDWPYLEAAVRYGRIDVLPAGRNRWALQILLARPQGLYRKQFADDRPEWAAFEHAMRGYLTERFELQLAPGVPLADLAKTHWPSRVSMLGGVLSFSIDSPGVRLGDLANASLTFWAGDVDAARLPAMIRVRSRDPRAAFDEPFVLSWTRVPLYVFHASEEYSSEYANLSAGPFPLSVRMDTVLAAVDPLSRPGMKTDSIRGRASTQ